MIIHHLDRSNLSITGETNPCQNDVMVLCSSIVFTMVDHHVPAPFHRMNHYLKARNIFRQALLRYNQPLEYRHLQYQQKNTHNRKSANESIIRYRFRIQSSTKPTINRIHCQSKAKVQVVHEQPNPSERSAERLEQNWSDNLTLSSSKSEEAKNTRRSDITYCKMDREGELCD